MQLGLAFCLLFSNVIYNVALESPYHYVEPASMDTKLWAVLVAGSSEWYNYRHQADICHSFQVLKNHGIPEERIIVFMYDDLANSSNNPTPGVIINHPKGHDVYKGVPRDYTGKDVTPENFMAVLRGDKKAMAGIGSGKVLKSGKDDHVFVYFADHGAPGLIAFPYGELTARNLSKTINYMHKHKKYGKMVIYIEACESGSMFKNILPKHINVYATTAANSKESSYACYYDDERDTYLGDLYSVNWLEDSDKEILTKETLYQQFKIVRNETNESHVQEFGDMAIANMHVSEFQGKKPSEPVLYPKVKLDLISSRDVPIEILKRKYEKSNSVNEQVAALKKLNKMLRNRLFLSQKVDEIVADIFPDSKNKSDLVSEHPDNLKNWDCYDAVRAYFNEECFNISKNEYALGFLYVLVNLCETQISAERIKIAMDRVCVHPPVHGII